jgi:3-methylcrotonyl-CoA carboxylase alpha subunit
VLHHGGTTATLRARPDGDGWRIAHAETTRYAALRTEDGGTLLRCGDVTRPVSVRLQGSSVTVVLAGVTHIIDVVDPLSPPRADVADGGRVMAPIPGRVASVLVKPGDAVVRNQVLVVLEAMKMELTLTAPDDGIVSAVHCAPGDMVEEGIELVHFAEPDDV